MSDDTELRLASSVLLTIDVQNDFTLSGAPAEVAGTRQALPAMQQAVAAYRRAALPIVHVVRLYLPDGSNAELSRRPGPSRPARVSPPRTVPAPTSPMSCCPTRG